MTSAGGKTEVEVKVAAKEDTDKLFDSAMSSLAYPEPEEKTSKAGSQEDDYRTFRTNTILVFLGFNMFLIIFMTSKYFLNWTANLKNFTGTANPYMVFIFYSVAGLALVRFIGSAAYLLLRLCGC